MKRLGVAMAVAALFAATPVTELLLAQEFEAEAQGRRGKKEAAPKAGGDTAKGMAEAPAVVQAAGLRCSVSEASFLGASKAGEKLYEVACSDGPGYILIQNADATIKTSLECVQLRDGNAAQAAAGTADPNALSCKLPGNANPVRGLGIAFGPLVPGCTVDGARWLGATNGGKDNIYEIGCAGTPGAVIKTSVGAAPQVTPCARTGGNLTCELTSAEEKLAPMRALASRSGKTCQVSDSRYVGTSDANKEDFYELKCAEGAGFIVVANQTDGGFKRVIECSRAQNVGGGCTMTDAVEAQTAEAAVYKQLASKAGFACDVSSYRVLGAQAGKSEVVELACNNQPEGLVAFFPVNPSEPTQFYDCSKIGAVANNLRCSLTKPETINARLTRDVQKQGKTCQVTGFRAAGANKSAKTDLVEVSCANGPGLMVEYPQGDATKFAPATGVFTCAEAGSLAGGCKLTAARS